MPNPTRRLDIHEHEPDPGLGPEDRFYIFDDIAQMFWPNEFDKANHSAEEKVIDRLAERGYNRVMGQYMCYRTPWGDVHFDSESGAFECHSHSRAAVEHVRFVIFEIADEFDKHREALK